MPLFILAPERIISFFFQLRVSSKTVKKFKHSIATAAALRARSSLRSTLLRWEPWRESHGRRREAQGSSVTS